MRLRGGVQKICPERPLQQILILTHNIMVDLIIRVGQPHMQRMDSDLLTDGSPGDGCSDALLYGNAQRP